MDQILPPFHLLAYSTLLGAELYQSFVMVKIAYQALPRSAFTSLQKRAFPIYFRIQSMLLVVVAATAPPRGLLSVWQTNPDWISFAVAGLTAGLNLFVFGPKTQDLMIQRVHQATRDASMNLARGVVRDETKQINRAFSRAHAMSIHLNLLTIGATLFYGWRLSRRLNFDGTRPGP
ncbi:hypothetical protein DE146DRAFT_674739 [Phaeosphaeria sp. MPI-PUGE-AT-0046c]|nr:hypothetical protein DE146DRAFT_674739 [Phaeosphaeria sp. MPI-PUGE-AT-0046c]